ncbi:MAG: hypothetical protein PHD65_12035 [Gallionella sp.]|nr:hypothetical protein [Gallionella sp.]
MLNFTHTILQRPINKALPYAVFEQDGLTIPSPRFLPMRQSAFKTLSGDTKLANLLGNDVSNILCAASEGRPSMFFMDVEFIHEMEAIKASAKESGDRSCEALAIASLTLYRLTKNRTAFSSAIKKWAGMIDRDAIMRNLPYIRKTNEDLVSHIHSISQWRSLKQGPEAVRKFAQKRIDLAERMKAIIPKEASAWAISQITNGDLNSYLPEIIKTRNLYYVAAVISDGNILFLPALAEKIAQMDDMELWTEEHLINALIEFKEIRSLLTDELYRVIFSIYATSATSLWTFIDQHEPIENSVPSKLDLLPGVVSVGDCEDDECQHDQQISGNFDLDWMFSMVGSAVCESKAWGEFAPFIKTIFDMDSEARFKLLGEMSSANAVVWRAGQELIEELRLKEITLKNARKEKKQAAKDMEHAKVQIANLNRQVGEMRKARTKPGSKPVSVDMSLFEEELKLSRKTNDQVRDELGKKEAELKQVYELLDSVLSSQHEDGSHVPVKLSPSELIEKRGIVIGGHYTLIAKLRKELTNCQFYSPDAKSLDDDAVRNCEYILFFTGYVNHCLTGHALRLSRLYNIPCGYTHRTNVTLVLNDIEAIFAGSVLSPVAAVC